MEEVTFKMFVDFSLLRNQKEAICEAISLLSENSNNKHLVEDLEGLLNMFDTMQDQAAKTLGEEAVFGKALE
jgi:hypothetical protein